MACTRQQNNSVLNMLLIDSVSPIYEIIEPDENQFEKNTLNSTSELLNMQNFASVDLSKIKYNPDSGSSNAQTSINYAAEH